LRRRKKMIQSILGANPQRPVCRLVDRVHSIVAQGLAISRVVQEGGKLARSRVEPVEPEVAADPDLASASSGDGVEVQLVWGAVRSVAGEPFCLRIQLRQSVPRGSPNLSVTSFSETLDVIVTEASLVRAVPEGDDSSPALIVSFDALSRCAEPEHTGWRFHH